MSNPGSTWQPTPNSGWQQLLDRSPTITTILNDDLQVLRQFGGSGHHALARQMGADFSDDSALMEACTRVRDSGMSETIISVTDSSAFDHHIQRQILGEDLLIVVYSTDSSVHIQQQKQAQMLDNLLNSIPGAVLVYDYETETTTYANRTIEDITGIPLAETENHTYIPHVHPDDREWVEDYGWNTLPHLKDGEVTSYDARIPHAENGWVWVHVRDTVLSRFPDGRVKEILCVLVDITERKALEAEFHVTKRRFDLLFEQSADGIAISRYQSDDPAEAVLMAINPRMTEIVGYTFEELQENGWQSTYPPEEIDKLRQRVAHFRSAGQIPVIERRFFRKDGSEGWVESMATVIFDEDGSLAEAVTMVRDITERKRLEAERQTALLRFRSLAENIPQWILRVSADMRYLYVNPSVGATLGVDVEDLIGRPIHETPLLSSDLLTRWRDGLQRSAAQKVIQRSELAVDLNHDQIILQMATVPEYDDDGKLISFLNVATDITELRLREAALREARRQAEVALQTRERFLASVSHELRTPLNAILGFSDVLLMKPDITEDAVTQLRFIRSSGTYLKRLINDVLDVSQMSLGQFQLLEGVVDLPGIFEQIVQTFTPIAEKRNIQLVAEINPDLPQKILADDVRLQQIISNIVDNALKFTPEGQVTLRASTEAGWLILTVADTGHGLSESIRERLFEAFATESLERGQSSGMGLGLYIVKSLVTLMGGTITADNRPDGGAIIEVHLPLALADAAPISARPQSDQQIRIATQGIRALIVDDVAANAALFELWFKSWGFEARTLHDGAGVIQQLNTWKPQIVLLDLFLPEIDGIRLAEMIRARPDGDQVTLIAATASAAEKDHRRARQAGFDALLTKPVSQAELAQMLEMLLTISLEYQAVPAPDAAHETPASDDMILAQLRQRQPDWLREMYVTCGAALLDGALELVSAIEADDPELSAALHDRIAAYRITEIADLIEPLLTQS